VKKGLDYKACKCHQDQTHFFSARFLFLFNQIEREVKEWIKTKEQLHRSGEGGERERVGLIPQREAKNSDFMRWYLEKLVTLDPIEMGW